MADLSWYCVLDRDEPTYGAHIILAKSETEAIERGAIAWGYELGEDSVGTMHAEKLHLPVTDEQRTSYEGNDE